MSTAVAFIGKVACSGQFVGAIPIRHTLVTGRIFPASVADAKVAHIWCYGLSTNSIHTWWVANRLVAKVAFISLFTFTSVGVTATMAMGTAGHGNTVHTVFSFPSVKANAVVGRQTAAVFTGATVRNVTVGSRPSFITFTFQSGFTSSMNTSWQRHTSLTVGSFPANFAGTIIWSPAFTMKTSPVIVLTDRLHAWVKFIPVISVQRLPPPRLANDVAVRITNVSVGSF